MRPSLFLLPILLCAIASAQTHTLDKEKSSVLLEAAAREGLDLPVPHTVSDNVNVTAVLLTQGSVRRLFGKEIATTYAVVQLTISNKSPDAAFVLHSAYIDTSQWALGGGNSRSETFRGKRYSSRAGTSGNQISSVEARIARGQTLDAQQWSARNWTVRLLTVAGSIASGYTFAFKEAGIGKGIAAFSGSFVPGVAFAWPDGAVAQLNRISDLGYQTNKVIAKDSADIIVCFFPIDMFLSKPFKKLFLDSPGLFLSPYQILFDDQVLETLKIGPQAKAAMPLLPCYSKQFEIDGGKKSAKLKPHGGDLRKKVDDSIVHQCSQQLMAPDNENNRVFLDYIGRFGLQNIGVYVDGVMTVDVDAVPASIDDVTFTNDATQASFWNTAGQQNGTMLCRFCQGGQVDIVEKDALGITGVTTADDSPHNTLNFSFTISKAIPTGTIVHFTITKPGDSQKNTKDVKSAPFTYSINYPTAPK